MTSQSRPDRLNRSSNEVMEATSFLFGTNAAFIESLYAQYLENPDAVDPTWRAWFASLGESDLKATQLGRGPAWKRDGKPELRLDELTGALSGQWPPKKPPTAPVPSHCGFSESIDKRGRESELRVASCRRRSAP